MAALLLTCKYHHNRLNVVIIVLHLLVLEKAELTLGEERGSSH